MAYTWEELHKTPVKKLREIAEEQGDHAELHGFRPCTRKSWCRPCATSWGSRITHTTRSWGSTRAAVKAQIRALKVERDEAMAAKDSVELKRMRRKIHRLKRKLHKATV